MASAWDILYDSASAGWDTLSGGASKVYNFLETNIYDPIKKNVVDPMVDFWKSDTVQTVKDVAQTAKSLQTPQTPSQFQPDLKGQYGGYDSTMKLQRSSMGSLGYSSAQKLQALGFTSSQDMQMAANSVMSSSNPSIQAQIARAARRRSMGPTISLASETDVPMPRVRQRSKIG